MFTSNPSLINLDGLQNIRYVGGGLTMQGLEGNYGRAYPVIDPLHEASDPPIMHLIPV